MKKRKRFFKLFSNYFSNLIYGPLEKPFVVLRRIRKPSLSQQDHVILFADYRRIPDRLAFFLFGAQKSFVDNPIANRSQGGVLSVCSDVGLRKFFDGKTVLLPSKLQNLVLGGC